MSRRAPPNHFLSGPRIDPPPITGRETAADLIDGAFMAYNAAPEFQREMGTAEFHHLCGRYVRAREEALGLGRRSLLAAAFEFGVPIYTSSPGDSSIGMNVAAMALEGNLLRFDVNADVNETAAIVWDAKGRGGKSAVWVLGG